MAEEFKNSTSGWRGRLKRPCLNSLLNIANEM